MKQRPQNTEKIIRAAQYVVFILFWGGLVTVCFLYRDKITVESVVSFTPDEPLLAALMMLALYAVKSVSFFIYGGILNVACGVMFPLPQALLVNTAGTIVMTLIPFLLGRKFGKRALTKLTQRYPKLKSIQDFPSQNGFFVSFFVRIVGLLPGDLIGLYLGASGISFKEYFWGTMLGLLPPVYAFTVMGTSIHDPSSPQFIISTICEVGICVVSLLAYALWKHKKSKQRSMEVSS